MTPAQRDYAALGYATAQPEQAELHFSQAPLCRVQVYTVSDFDSFR